jgi:hypothetical protein
LLERRRQATVAAKITIDDTKRQILEAFAYFIFVYGYAIVEL